ncbi:MAG: phosphate ABC transporter permease subunit PstC [Cenarchaeum sp. SB0663_bin_5]|nr:phosphate ABC transporter permease subunit PstC [Cenarchaeum sp. SB0663_bin_5]MYH04090.1 phosphate ABC transporter permease subunit PstC [Cenarchaeum sp. SB0675_bin_21]MYL11525.1 phosphate ABC transporter permease subunit PstC [Cenarchaeum sp. SB0669_bin_11]
MAKQWFKRDEKEKKSLLSDKIFKFAAAAAGAYVLAVILIIVLQLGIESMPIWEEEGIGFITGTDWNPVPGRESFGAFPYILGTLITSAIALAIGFPLSIGIAMLVMIIPKKIGQPLGYLVELIEAVPSVVFGLWGLFVFRIYFRDLVEKPLHDMFGDSIFLFGGTPFGLDIMTASIILAIMIIPTISSISREVMMAVPQQQREAAYMLGSTTFEMFRMAIFPYSKTGLLGASMLGLGRAVGETMAVTMLIGNTTGLRAIPQSLFDSSQTMPSIIANEFIEASPVSLHPAALVGIGLILLAVGLSINVAAHFLVARMVKVNEGPIH